MANTLPLPEAAVAILKGLKERAVDEFVFNISVRSNNALDKAKKVMDKMNAFQDEWRFHDLRRSGASTLASFGIAQPVTERILNHRSGVVSGIAAVYNRHDYKDEMRMALERYAIYIQNLEHSGNVVDLDSARKRA